MRSSLALGFLGFIAAAALFYAMAGNRFEMYGAAYAHVVILRSACYVGLLAGGCFYAARFGGAPERIAAWIVAATFVADPVLHLLLKPRFDGVDPTHVIIDLARFAGLAAVALRANRFWPIWLSAFQLLALGAHLAKSMDLDIHPVIYGAMEAMWSYGIVIGLMLATRHHRRLTAGGATRRSWSVFSQP